MTDEEDEQLQDELEAQPWFIASQLRPGHTLTEEDVKSIQSILSELENRENTEVETFHRGRIAALHEIGGADLVTAVEMQDHQRIATVVRKTMDRIFPKEQRTKQ